MRMLRGFLAGVFALGLLWAPASADTIFGGRGGLLPPQTTVLTTGTAQTYNTPAGALYLSVTDTGAGGGGGGSGTAGGNAGTGGTTSFGAISCTGGAAGAGSAQNNASAGTCSGASFTVPLGTGTPGVGSGTFVGGGTGGANPFGQQSITQACCQTNVDAVTPGVGGVGATTSGTGSPGSGGGPGGYGVLFITGALSPTYTYSVGAPGTAGAAGTSGNVGSAGGPGRLIVTAFFQ